MKYPTVVLCVLVFSVSPAYTFAQSDSLPPAGITPSSPLYIIDTFFEGIGTLFTFGDSAKSERYLKLAEERLAEAKAESQREAQEDEKVRFIDTALSRYEAHLDEALAQFENTFDSTQEDDNGIKRAERTFGATLQHQTVLADIYENAPEPARTSVREAVEHGVSGYARAVGSFKAHMGSESSGANSEQIRAFREKLESQRSGAESRLETLRRDASVPPVPAFSDIPPRYLGPPSDGSPRACPADAKQCPDGSYIERTGPNCTFEPCPGEDDGDDPLPNTPPPHDPRKEENPDQVIPREEGVANVEHISIAVLESFPVQVRVTAEGAHPNGCTGVDDTSIKRTGNTFNVTITTTNVTITTTRPEEFACTQAFVPFEERIDLPVRSLSKGTYTVDVNGVTGTFKLEQDNEINN